MDHLKYRIEVKLLEEAERYFLALNEKVQAKFLKAFDKTEAGLRAWFEKLQTKEGIFEFRERDQEINIIEFLHFGMETLSIKPLILCTHGLDKKTNKTPNSEIAKAIKRLNNNISKIKIVKNEVNHIIRTKR